MCTRLCAHQLGDDEQRVAGLAGSEAMGLHRWMDDRGVAAVVALDPLAGELGVGDVGRRLADLRDRSHLTHPAQLQAQKRAQRGGNLAERSSLLIPCVAKRGVTVADVYRARGNAHAVGERAAAAEDNVGRRQLAAVRRPRIERQQAPEVGLTRRRGAAAARW